MADQLSDTLKDLVTSPSKKILAIGDMDILFIYPSYGHSDDKARFLPTRVSVDVPNQESPNIGIGYLIPVSKRAGIEAKFVETAPKNLSMLISTWVSAEVKLKSFILIIRAQRRFYP